MQRVEGGGRICSPPHLVTCPFLCTGELLPAHLRLQPALFLFLKHRPDMPGSQLPTGPCMRGPGGDPGLLGPPWPLFPLCGCQPHHLRWGPQRRQLPWCLRDLFPLPRITGDRALVPCGCRCPALQRQSGSRGPGSYLLPGRAGDCDPKQGRMGKPGHRDCVSPGLCSSCCSVPTFLVELSICPNVCFLHRSLQFVSLGLYLCQYFKLSPSLPAEFLRSKSTVK